jgi:pimeloyl-ACP methyl ester carboxylesterase
MSSQFFTTYDGLRISYEIIDECDGDYLLLHTGLNSYKEAWKELSYTDAFKNDFKIILIDPRGHGMSDKPKDLAKYSYKKMADDVAALLDHLGIQKIYYFGYSLGALIGWRFAQFHQDRLICLVAGGSRIRYPKDYTNVFLRLQFLQEGEIINRDIPFKPTDIESFLPSLKIPVLVFSGEEDQSTISSVPEYAKLVPNCTSFTIPGLNHPQTVIQKEKILPQIKEFLKKNK